MRASDASEDSDSAPEEKPKKNSKEKSKFALSHVRVAKKEKEKRKNLNLRNFEQKKIKKLAKEVLEQAELEIKLEKAAKPKTPENQHLRLQPSQKIHVAKKTTTKREGNLLVVPLDKLDTVELAGSSGLDPSIASFKSARLTRSSAKRTGGEWTDL
ncbi:hypothetical protein HDU91_006504 [Kappamyces sp. JEL0680]|nr:hypothetical protein HDU91_006504 [Kappamyces sp. JEL0680]